LTRPWIPAIALLFAVSHAPAQRPSFEVVSIKVNKSGSDGGTMGPRAGRLVATNVPLRTLLVYGYSPPDGQLLNDQIIGEPGWAQTEHFDIEAKFPGSDARVPGAQVKAMVRSLLEDRFQLKAHTETRELPVYNLVVMKSGPKLSADQTPPDPRRAFIQFATEGSQLAALERGALRMVTGPATTLLTGTGISVPRIVQLLQGKSDRMILDKTGVTGLLDVNLTFRPDLGTDADQTAPSLFTAIQETGLKLEPGKAPLEVLVVDGVQRPSEN
jgi:uncharacterized protein (TIGR03435 family)